MPAIIQQPDMHPSYEPAQASMDSMGRYPTDANGFPLDFRPKGALHERIKGAINDRCREARMAMERRFPTWQKINRTVTAYVPLDEAEEALKNADDRKPVSVVVPTSFAVRETIMAYLRMALLESPYFRYEGHGPEDSLGAIKLEMIIDQQCRNYKAGLPLLTMLKDGLTYGFGVVSVVWDTKRGKRTIMTPQGFTSMITGAFETTGYLRQTVETLLFEGNRLINIDPFSYLPDPNVPMEHVQKGEFVGWLSQESRTALLSKQKNDPAYFNVEFLEKGRGRSTLYLATTETGRQERFGSSVTSVHTDPFDVVCFYWDLIPRDWGLGPSPYPEKWYFEVAADEIIIRAQPLNLDHDQFPVAVYAPNSDGYETTPISQLEVVYGLQEFIDFLVSSHIANVRKAVNDMLVVDPLLVNIDDLENPGPGRLIRLNESAWGKGVKDAVAQLSITDITRNNMTDAMMTNDIIKSVTGAVDSTQGVIRQSNERVSATQARDAKMSAVSRLSSLAFMASLQSMQDIGYLMACQTQQLMTKASYVKSMGTWQDVLAQEFGIFDNRILITPQDIMIEYDIVQGDGSIPGTEYVDVWMQLFQGVSTNPMLAQTFDIVRIFKHIARLLGAKNINDFVIGGNPLMKMQVMAPGMVEQGVQAGNLAPLEAMDGQQGMERGTLGGDSAGVPAGLSGAFS